MKLHYMRVLSREYLGELHEVGARITCSVHDEIHFEVKRGTELKVRALHKKYFPESRDPLDEALMKLSESFGELE